MDVIDKKIEYTNYSKELNKIFLTKYLDELIKYNNKNKNINLLYSNYQINYNTYDNRYKKINKENLYKYINNKFNLSYSKEVFWIVRTRCVVAFSSIFLQNNRSEEW